ncbi:hypothetical protein [Gemmobacter serpentinus]|uniref:hypothetical protein n=1 Tax=Gemmobacter serpentinus TaxID=2652247 RepID=UPI00124EC964|nr:hypothetical protein [Gemmobacter serpentinus]
MKPNFALTFAADSIGLLHRTARGWLEIGTTSIDAPDLGEALSYLRRSALGLAPHGVATKLIIPDEQILYMEVEAPGPSDAKREAQIRRALEGRTPYMVEELVFDWSGEGHMVQVAVVARETLQEAEAFANEYRLNPISFVAQPDPAKFAGEPWFGPSSLAPGLLPEGEVVERDNEPVQVVSRDAHRAARIEAAAREAASRPAPPKSDPAAEAPAPARSEQRARKRAERAAVTEAAVEAAPDAMPAPFAASIPDPPPVMAEGAAETPPDLVPEAVPADAAGAEHAVEAAFTAPTEDTPPAVTEAQAIAEVSVEAAPQPTESVWPEAEFAETSTAVDADPQGGAAIYAQAETPIAADATQDLLAPHAVSAAAFDPAEIAPAAYAPEDYGTAEGATMDLRHDRPDPAVSADLAHRDLAHRDLAIDTQMTEPAFAEDPGAEDLGLERHHPAHPDADDLGPEAPVWLAADETPEPPRAASHEAGHELPPTTGQTAFDFAPQPVIDPRFAAGQMSEPRIALPDGANGAADFDFSVPPLAHPSLDDDVERPPVFASAKRSRGEAEPVAPAPTRSHATSRITVVMNPQPETTEPEAPSGFAEGFAEAPAEYTPEPAGDPAAGRLAVTSITPHRRAPAAPLTPPATSASAAAARPYDPTEAAATLSADIGDAYDAGFDGADLPPPVAPQIREALAASRANAAPGTIGAAPPRAAAKPAAKSGKTGLGALVTAPGIPGFGGRNRNSKPAKAAPATAGKTAAQTLVAPPPEGMAPETMAGSKSARGMASAPIKGRGPVRQGKPRFLGLILTGLLLLALAVIGAWSSITLSRSNATPASTTEQPQDVASSSQSPALDPDQSGVTALSLDTAATGDPAADLEADLAQQTNTEDTPSIDDEAFADGEAVTDVTPATATQDPATTDGPAPATGNLLLTDTAPAAAQGQQDEIILSTMDAPPPSADAFALAQPQAQGDTLPAAAPPPPPFGTQYEFEANGLIKATPQGIVTPDGYFLIAGRPAKVPPPRPASIAAMAAAAATPDAAEPAIAAPAVAADPSLQGFRPRPRPEGLTGPTAEDDAALAIPEAQRITSLHPRARPASITRIAEQHRRDEEARKAAEAASLSATAAANAAAATVPQGEDATAEALALAAAASTANAGPISPQAVAISRKPPKKPRNFDARVQAAVAAAAAPTQRSQPQVEAEPAAQPAARSAAARKVEPGEDEEPEVAQTRVPKIPSSASVAKNATYVNAINLGKTNLIGVYGTPSRRYALIRLGSGQYKKISVGDRVDGGTVAAITENEVRYKKGGRMVALAMPRG